MADGIKRDDKAMTSADVAAMSPVHPKIGEVVLAACAMVTIPVVARRSAYVAARSEEMLRKRSPCISDTIRRLPQREEHLMTHRIDRRNFLTGTARSLRSQRMRRCASAHAQAQIPVPNSSGTRVAKLKAPANACDCHMHIYDPARFPMPPSQRVAPANATVAEYRLLQKRIGTTRVVVVQPRNYAIDNRVTLDAIKQLAPNARGVAVLHPTVTDAELKTLNDAGIRGIRFSLGDPATAAVTPDMVEPLAKRIADLGWHVQFNVEGEQIVELADVLRRLPTPMVFDHLANPGPDGRRSSVARDRPRV